MRVYPTFAPEELHTAIRSLLTKAGLKSVVASDQELSSIQGINSTRIDITAESQDQIKRTLIALIKLTDNMISYPDSHTIIIKSAQIEMKFNYRSSYGFKVVKPENCGIIRDCLA